MASLRRDRLTITIDKPVELRLLPFKRLPPRSAVVAYLKQPGDAPEWVLHFADTGSFASLTVQGTMRTIDERKVRASLVSLGVDPDAPQHLQS
jgi:hypothetical protein